MNLLNLVVRHKKGASVGLVILALAGFFGWHAWQGKSVAAEMVQERAFVQTVVASGRVESPFRAEIGTQITGTVKRIPVKEGQVVQGGALLIELDDTELQAAERQAMVAVEQESAKLRQLVEVRAPVAEQAERQALANLVNARAALQRNEALFSKKFIGEVALDESRKALELADAQWRASQKQMDATRVSGSDYAVAVTAVALARANLEASRARRNNASIRAPRDGILIGRKVEVGDVVQAGKILMTLSPHGTPQLVLAIDEKNLRYLALGQTALASVDAYAAEKFTATLSYISPSVDPQTGAIEVKLNVDRVPAFVRQDMTVSVDIEVARRPKTLLVSALAVHALESGAPWVMQDVGGRAIKTSVGVGLRGGGWVEIVHGLKAGDVVLHGSAADVLQMTGNRVQSKFDPAKVDSARVAN